MTDNAVRLRHLGLLQHALQQGKWACCNMHFNKREGLRRLGLVKHALLRETGSLQHALQAFGLAATRTSTREMKVGGKAWYT